MSSDEHLSPTSPEWAAMWDALAAATGDYADCCPETGEVWQYMGTYHGSHQFRHRHRPQSCRPITGFAGQAANRVYLDLDAETLQVTRVNCGAYLEEIKNQRRIRTEYGHLTRPAGPPKPIRGTSDSDCAEISGAFDGWQVISDADPGL